MKIKQKYKEISYVTSLNEYNQMYDNSLNENDDFWEEKANNISWYKKWSNVSSVNYNKANIKWFDGASLNACYNCIDRHVENGDGDKTAIIWESNDPEYDLKYSYKD